MQETKRERSLQGLAFPKKKKKFLTICQWVLLKGPGSAVSGADDVICLYDILAEEADRGGHVGTEW